MAGTRVKNNKIIVGLIHIFAVHMGGLILPISFEFIVNQTFVSGPAPVATP